MKKGISIWSFADKTPESYFSLAKKYGYDGVEVSISTDGPLRLDSAKEEIEEFKALGESFGLEFYSMVSDFGWKCSLTSDDENERKAAKEIILKQLETASLLGCDAILILPGMVQGLSDSDPVVDYETVYDRALNALKELAPYAEKYNVVLGFENVWNKFLLSPLEMRDFTDKVNSPFVKVYFDVGNVLRDGFPEQWINILGERIVKIHFKDFKRSIGTLDGFTEILDGDVNYPKVMEALRNIGYDGWVTAEVFSKDGDIEGLLDRNSKAIDKIFKY